MNINYDLLTRPLNELLWSELEEIRQVAGTLFVKLCQPFSQVTLRKQFDFKKTLKTGQKLGHYLPQYRRVPRRNSKSRLVVAMSLSGIDRCYAVGLIPLFAELRKYLNFKLFIYTD